MWMLITIFILFLVGKLSEPSPLQTRSARKKKAELNATLATPVGKGVTPSKQLAGKKLNTPGGATPKVQTPASKAKGKKAIKVEEDEDDEDTGLKLALDEDMDSDDLDSDDSFDDHEEDDFDDDMESDEDSEDETGTVYNNSTTLEFFFLIITTFRFLSGCKAQGRT